MYWACVNMQQELEWKDSTENYGGSSKSGLVLVQINFRPHVGF